MDRRRIKEVIECYVRLNKMSDRLDEVGIQLTDTFDDVFMCLEHLIDDYYSELGCDSAVSEILDMIYDEDKLNNLYKYLE